MADQTLTIARRKLRTFLGTLSVNELAWLRDYHDGADLHATITGLLTERGVDALIEPRASWRVVETCEDRAYQCCETLSDAEHLSRYGYAASTEKP